MKRIVLCCAVVSNVLIANMDTNVCPDLSKKVFNIEEAKKIEMNLKDSNLWKVYSDSLKKYNHTDNITNYVSQDSILEYRRTPIMSDMLNLLYDRNINDKQKLSSEYNKLLNSIDPKNTEWCKETIKDKEIKQKIDLSRNHSTISKKVD